MKVLILSFSSNQVNEDSFIPNKIGLTFSCVEECEKQLKTLKYEYEHICINKKNIACAGGSGSGTEETLKSFDILNYFLGTEMCARIPITKSNFENQKEKIKRALIFNKENYDITIKR